MRNNSLLIPYLEHPQPVIRRYHLIRVRGGRKVKHVAIEKSTGILMTIEPLFLELYKIRKNAKK